MIKRWSHHHTEKMDSPKKVEDFLDEIEKVYEKYNLSISHEDHHGAFLIDVYKKDNIEWLREAHLKTKIYDTE